MVPVQFVPEAVLPGVPGLVVPEVVPGVGIIFVSLERAASHLSTSVRTAISDLMFSLTTE